MEVAAVALDARGRTLLSESKIMVLATVRADGRPHAVPIWFVWHDERLYFGTDLDTTKVRNIERNPEVAAVVERGGQEGASHAVIVQGRASRVAPDAMPAGAVAGFRGKYAWDPTSRAGATAFFVVEPTRIRSW
jgi:PPOX class probable F420-dependent enzyme